MKNMRPGVWLAAAACVVLLAGVGASRAALVTLTNPGFEDLGGATPPADGDGVQGVMPGWSILPNSTDAAGTHDPSALQVAGEAHGGTYAAYANDTEYSGPLAVRQTTSATWQANTQYTLTVYVARRTDLPGEETTGQAQFQLRDGTTDDPVIVDTFDVTGSGEWFAATLQVTTSDSDAFLGNLIAVQFRTVSGVQLLYDDISLDAEAIPEPTTLGLLAVGALGVLRRRNR
ncbi:MAG: PEP-CTERM sorting domain-containing protein [Phycisphaerae bacterium]|nr:PEP-CTERM sorting domain-containing protein [Phycisphaerae bacterium]